MQGNFNTTEGIFSTCENFDSSASCVNIAKEIKGYCIAIPKKNVQSDINLNKTIESFVTYSNGIKCNFNVNFNK